MVLNKVLLVLQIAIYFTSVGMSFIKHPGTTLLIVQIAIIIFSIVIKIFR